MKTVRKIDGIAADRPTAAAVGFFDGLHLGHRAVIEAACTDPQKLVPAVFTFSSGLSDLKPGAQLLMTGQEKENELEKMGVKLLVSLPFSEIKNLSAKEFVRTLLLERMQVKRICCGEDFRFGSGAKGDIALLRRICEEEKIELCVIPPVFEQGERISSTLIRELLRKGEIEKANRMLKVPFSICTEVLHGNQIGRTIHFSTINQAFSEGQIVLRYGVYASACLLNGVWHPSVTDVGVKPTVGSEQVLAETHILDYSGDLYGKNVKVRFLSFLRPEQKFASVEELSQQIRKDVKAVRALAECKKEIFKESDKQAFQAIF